MLDTARRPAATVQNRNPHRGSRWRAPIWIMALAVALLASCIVSIGVGPVNIPPGTVTSVMLNHLGANGEVTWSPATDNIVWLIRVPRVLLAVAVGASLALAGAVIQALVRNPLADPYLLGISSGATAGAAASLLFGAGLGAGLMALTGSALAGALLAAVIVFTVANVGGRASPGRLIFAGIAVGYALTAVTNLLVFTSDSRDGTRAVLFWALGSFSRANWQSLPIAGVAAIAAFLIFWWWSRRLDAIAIGDDTARSLGTNPTRFRALATVIASATIAASVAVSGAIGFVGLVVPHLARLLVGSVHRAMLPVAALLGSLLLVWADALARTAFAPRELPIGVLTAIVGTPLLIALVGRFATR